MQEHHFQSHGSKLVLSSSKFCEKIFPIVSLVQFPESLCISEDEPLLEFGQIIAVDEEHLVIRSAKPYLASKKATVHGHYGEIFDKGDTFITLIYERFKSNDIIQGLYKVDHLSEARLNNSISMNLKVLKNGPEIRQDFLKVFGGYSSVLV
jgi:DNA-directed RNA polymerase subunit beta'